MEGTRWMLRILHKLLEVAPWSYPKSKDVLAADQLNLITAYIFRCRYNITNTIEGWTLLEECSGGGEVEREFELPDVVAAGDRPGGGG